MNRRMVAVLSLIALVGTALAAYSWPLSEEQGYAAYRKGPCDRCVPGVKPALSTTKWILTPTALERHAQKPWLTIRVNGRDTDLGRAAVVLDKELMLPVMAAETFGLTPVRSGLNHRLLTLAGGRYLVRMRIGSRNAEVGYRLVCLPVCPKWQNGKVFMPLETLVKLLDWEASFNKLTGILSINTRAADLVAHRNAAAAAHTRRMWDEALAEYQAAQNLDPTDWWINRRMGDAYLEKGRFNDELAASHAAIAEALRKAAAAKALADRNPGGALGKYSEAMGTAGGRVDAYRNLSARFYPLSEVREPDQAMDIYEKTVYTDPGFNRVVRAGSTSLTPGAELEAAITQADNSALASIQRAREAYELAVARYTAALEQSSANAGDHVHLARELYRNNQPAKAAEEYQKALTVDPVYHDAGLELAQSLLAQGKLDEAVEQARKMVEQAPKSAAAHNLLGYALRRQGNLEDAIVEYEAAIGLAPKHAIAYNNLGVARMAQADLKGAVEALAKAVKLDGSSADFQANYGLALRNSGSDKLALAAWTKAVTLAPDNCEYHANLALLLQAQGDVDKALTEAALAEERFAKNSATLDRLAGNNAAGGDVSLAEARALLDVARLSARCTTAWALLEKGRIPDALAAAKAAVELGATSAEAQAVLAAVLVEQLDGKAALQAITVSRKADLNSPLYLAIAAAAHAAAGDQTNAQAAYDEAWDSMERNRRPDRWTAYFLGRAAAACGETEGAALAYTVVPMPTKFDSVRRQQIADYLKRHPVPKHVAKDEVAANAAATEDAEEEEPTAAAAPAVAPATGKSVRAEIAAADGRGSKPTLEIVNKTGVALEVLLDRGADRTLLSVSAAGSKMPTTFKAAGVHDVTVSAKGANALPLKMTYDFGAKAYTLTVTVE